MQIQEVEKQKAQVQQQSEEEDNQKKEEKERKGQKDNQSDEDDEKKKKKKKKKNKKHNREEDKEKQQQKYEQAVKNSFLHTVQQLAPQQRQKYAEIQNDPMKLICTNLPLKITIEQIINYFNTAIITSDPALADPPPIKDVELDKYRTFAILQLSQRRIKDYFSKHTDFFYVDGKTTFKVVRPKVFFQEKYGQKSKNITIVGPGERIYIGGLPHYFSDQQVKKICETFGKVKYITLIKQNGVSKGYGFFEYQDPKHTDKAILALNNLPVADRKLKCQKAALGGGNRNMSLAYAPSADIATGQQIKAKPANHSGSYLVSYDNIQDAYIQKTLSNNPDCKIPSRVVQFLNMFYIQDLFDEQTYENLKADLQQQCSKYGQVDKIVIPRPDSTCGYSVPTVGKAFVKFKYIISAKRARVAIAGKVYNKRTVITSFYSEQKFNMRQYLVSL